MSQAAAKAQIVLCAEQIQLGWVAGESQAQKTFRGGRTPKRPCIFLKISTVFTECGIKLDAGLAECLPACCAITERGNSLQGGARCSRCGTSKNKPRFSLLLSGWALEQLGVGKITLKCFSSGW